MLPTSVSLDRGQSRRASKLRKTLLSRSRATNLAVLGLACLAFLSLLLNVQYYVSAPFTTSLIASSSLTLLPELQQLKHLIIVPGHAIWQGVDPDLRLSLDQWAFQTYQKNQDQSARLDVFFRHISNAVRLALSDAESLLVFSGGHTQASSTTSEGESYLRLALKSGLIPAETFHRATSEDYALDSFQNLLFSIARFYEYTGAYPETITVVGYEMKRDRFVNLHRAALRWPAARFDYIGVDIDGDNTLAREGELQNGYLPYVHDLYGCHDYLASKRRQRNQDMRHAPYLASNPELGPLLAWCPKQHTRLYSGPLPWSTEQLTLGRE